MRCWIVGFAALVVLFGTIHCYARPGDFQAVQVPGGYTPMWELNPLAGVPTYTWWYGCSPTSGGMMVGYWDAQPGYGDLYEGDASVWSGDGNSGTRRTVASTAHITAGAENGYTYGDYHNSPSYPTHEANPDCMADFMHTVDSGSNTPGIVSGLEAYVEWDNPTTATNEGAFDATVTALDVPYYGGTFSFDVFKSEIDANRPVLLDVITARVSGDWVGHSIVGYGYSDNMFQVKLPHNEANVTVGGIAVRDTWTPGSGAQSEWVDWNYNLVEEQFSGGHEWWPFIQFNGYSWVYSNPAYTLYDWMVMEGITLDIQIEEQGGVIPEPSSVVIWALLGLVALAWHARRRSRRG